MSKGIDVSDYTDVTNWTDVKNSGVEFVYVKATEGSANGTAYISPTMNNQFTGAKSAGIHVGFYHYAKFVSVADAIEEAKWLVSNIKSYAFTLPPALDLEENNCGSDLESATFAFLNYVQEQLGSAILYTDGWLYEIVKSVTSKYGLWFVDLSGITIDKTLSELYAWQNNWNDKTVNGISSDSYVDSEVVGGKFFTTENKLLVKPKPSGPIFKGMPLLKGQIGCLTTLKPIDLWKDGSDGKLHAVKVLQPNHVYRVYGYREAYGGQYDVGGHYYVTKIADHIKYETPSKELLDQVK